MYQEKEYKKLIKNLKNKNYCSETNKILTTYLENEYHECNLDLKKLAENTKTNLLLFKGELEKKNKTTLDNEINTFADILNNLDYETKIKLYNTSNHDGIHTYLREHIKNKNDFENEIKRIIIHMTEEIKICNIIADSLETINEVIKCVDGHSS